MMRRLLTYLFLLLFSGQMVAQNLFTGKHEDAWIGLSLGYVNKYWRTDMGDKVIRENIWGEEGKKIHGVQVGVLLQPCLPVGLGLHSGLFYEYYYSVSQAVKNAGYDDFREHNLYLPLHALYRLPITTDASVSIFGGLGFNLAMWGSYNNSVRVRHYDGTLTTDSYVGEWQKYGNGEWPRHFNAQWEIGCSARINIFQLRFTYSRGLTDHHFYDGYKTQQNKIGISIELVGALDD